MNEQLRVMTFNIRYHTPDDGQDAWPNRRKAVFGIIGLHRPDIVGVQEALPGQFAELRSGLPEYTWLGVGRRDGVSEGEYAAIGIRPDRFDVEATDTFWLSETPGEAGRVGWDADEPRIVTWAKLRDTRSGERIAHYNTHFDHLGEIARRESAALLRKRVEETPDTHHLVITGDFNCTRRDEPLRRLTSAETSRDRTPRLAKGPHARWTLGPDTSRTDFASIRPGLKIDHILVSESLDVDLHATVTQRRADGRYPSDHLPVIASLAY